jgi:hypothetical protein
MLHQTQSPLSLLAQCTYSRRALFLPCDRRRERELCGEPLPLAHGRCLRRGVHDVKADVVAPASRCRATRCAMSSVVP